MWQLSFKDQQKKSVVNKEYINQEFVNEISPSFFSSHSKDNEMESFSFRLQPMTTRLDPWPEKIQAHQVLLLQITDVVVTVVVMFV